MKLNFINISQFMLRLFQLTTIAGVLFSLFVLLVVNDTSTNMTYGPLNIKHGKDLARSADISITPLSTTTISPKIVVDNARIVFPVYGQQPRIIISALIVIIGAVIIYGLYQLLLIIRSVQEGNPFIRSNVWRIYTLALIIYATPLFDLIYSWTNFSWVKANFTFSGLELTWRAPEFSHWLIFGTLLITIGKIFEQGIKLREENQLTV